jgi:antitoxin component YwqK of YwqJK toxin-antitoxin module
MQYLIGSMSRKELIKTEAMSKKIKSPIIVLLGVVIISIGCSSESTKQKSKDDVVERKVKNKIQLDQLHCIGDSIYYTIKDNITFTGLIYSDTLLVGSTINGKKEGVFYSYNFDGSVFMEEMYKNGKLNGLSKHYFQNGNIDTEAYFKDNQKDGVQKMYREDGKIRDLWTFKNGVQNGEFKLWYSNGTLRFEGTKKNGFTFGKYREYNEDGSLKHEENIEL